MDFIIDEILNDTVNIELWGDIDDDGRQNKILLENVRCYINHLSKIKYVDTDKSVILNGYVYIKGRVNDGKIRDGKVIWGNTIHKIVGFREYRDFLSGQVVYTKLEVV